MQTQISPSANNPIVVLTRTSKTHHTFTKYWHSVQVPQPHSRNEQVWSSTCKIDNVSPTGNATESILLLRELNYVNIHEQKWNKARLLTPSDALVALTFYDPETNKFSHASVKKWGTTLIQPYERDINCKFANNPEHIFCTQQARALYHLLSSTVANPADNPTPQSAYQQFLSLWPNINQEDFEKYNYPENRTLSNVYPNTIQQAAAHSVTVSKEAKARADSKYPTSGNNQQTPPIPQTQEPNLLHIESQPTSKNPLLIPHISFVNTRNPTSKLLPLQPHTIFLHIPPEGAQNKRREVFCALPLTNELPAYPISPLKATVAILFCNLVDSQPFIASINTNLATIGERNTFFDKYSKYMNKEQLEQFEEKQHREPPIGICPECQREFALSRSFAKFCSYTCRIDHNSKLRKLSEEAKKESNHKRSLDAIGRAKPKHGAEAVARYGICFPDLTYYRGPDRTETSLIHNPANRDFKHFAKAYTLSTAEAIISEFPLVFAGCTVEVLNEPN